MKLTMATVEGEHFAVYFGRLTGLAQDQQFVRWEKMHGSIELSSDQFLDVDLSGC